MESVNLGVLKSFILSSFGIFISRGKPICHELSKCLLRKQLLANGSVRSVNSFCRTYGRSSQYDASNGDELCAYLNESDSKQRAMMSWVDEEQKDQDHSRHS